jgi:hypothetical protein
MSPQVESGAGVIAMKLMHICYAALGLAVARWIYKRQSMPIADPVSRFRTSGLL